MDGLGRAVAQSLLDQGHRLELHARSEDRAAARRARVVLRTCWGRDLESGAETKGIADQIKAIGRIDAIIQTQASLNQRVPGSSPGAPTNLSGKSIGWAIFVRAQASLARWVTKPIGELSSSIATAEISEWLGHGLALGLRSREAEGSFVGCWRRPMQERTTIVGNGGLFARLEAKV
ncbi:hypothetical protein [Bradyrhizobium sp. Pha-3]